MKYEAHRAVLKQEFTDDDKMQGRSREKAAATELAISLMGHRGVKRWLAAGNCGPPEPLYTSCSLVRRASDSQWLCQRSNCQEIILAGHVK